MENETKPSEEVMEAVVISVIAIATKVEISSIHQKVRLMTTSGAGTKYATRSLNISEGDVEQTLERLISKGKVSMKAEETVFSEQFFSLSDAAS